MSAFKFVLGPAPILISAYQVQCAADHRNALGELMFTVWDCVSVLKSYALLTTYLDYDRGVDKGLIAQPSYRLRICKAILRYWAKHLDGGLWMADWGIHLDKFGYETVLNDSASGLRCGLLRVILLTDFIHPFVPTISTVRSCRQVMGQGVKGH